MELTPAQKKIAKDTHRFRVVNAGRRFGKTVLSIEEMVGKAIAKQGRTVAYIAPTYGQARDIAWEQLKDRVRPIAEKINESRLEVIVNTQEGDTSRIMLSSWEKVEGLRGQSFDFLVIDEVAMMRNFWINWDEVVRPTLTDTKGDVLFISTPKGFNHFYDLFNREAEDDDFASFHFTTYDNPHIPEDEIDKAREELPSDRFHQEYMADFRKQEGLVYKEFSRDTHVFNVDDLDIKVYETIAGVDFGFTNPSAVITIKMDHQQRYYITNEWYKTGKTDAEVAEYVAGYKYASVYPDPENPAGIKEMKDKGVNVREVDKSRRNRDRGLRGVDDVRELLKQGRLFVASQCLNTIQEFETYRYPDSKEDRNDDERPVKENDHCFSADTTIYTTEGKRKIKDLLGETGFLFSRDGTVQPFHSVRKTRKNAKTLRITLSDGNTLTVTPDHLVLLESGVWAEVQTLSVG